MTHIFKAQYTTGDVVWCGASVAAHDILPDTQEGRDGATCEDCKILANVSYVNMCIEDYAVHLQAIPREIRTAFSFMLTMQTRTPDTNWRFKTWRGPVVKMNDDIRIRG